MYLNQGASWWGLVGKYGYLPVSAYGNFGGTKFNRSVELLA
jgi:hypothetical protein